MSDTAYILFFLDLSDVALNLIISFSHPLINSLLCSHESISPLGRERSRRPKSGKRVSSFSTEPPLNSECTYGAMEGCQLIRSINEDSNDLSQVLSGYNSGGRRKWAVRGVPI